MSFKFIFICSFLLRISNLAANLLFLIWYRWEHSISFLCTIGALLNLGISFPFIWNPLLWIQWVSIFQRMVESSPIQPAVHISEFGTVCILFGFIFYLHKLHILCHKMRCFCAVKNKKNFIKLAKQMKSSFRYKYELTLTLSYKIQKTTSTFNT